MSVSDWWGVVKDLPLLMSEPFLFGFPLWIYAGASLVVMGIIVFILYIWRDLDPIMTLARGLTIFSAGNVSTMMIGIYAFEVGYPDIMLAWTLIILVVTVVMAMLGFTSLLDRAEAIVGTTIDSTRAARRKRRAAMEGHTSTPDDVRNRLREAA